MIMPLKQANDISNGVELEKVAVYSEVKTGGIKTKEYKTEEKKERPQMVGVIRLFRFSTSFDILLIAIGILGAIVAGVSFPCIFIFFGDITDAFTQYSLVVNGYGENQENVDGKLMDATTAFAWKMCCIG